MDTRLDQAIRTLRAIRQRYEMESDAGHGRKRSYAVQVALGYADMRWIGAAIEALEKATRETPTPESWEAPAAASPPYRGRIGRRDSTLAVNDPPYAQVGDIK